MDGIPPHVLQICAQELAFTLRRPFLSFLDQNNFLLTWRNSIIFPIPSDTNNYRLITLTFALFWHVVSYQLRSLLERKRWRNDRQYGFCLSRSTAIYCVISQSWSTALDNREETYLILLGISKALTELDMKICCFRLGFIWLPCRGCHAFSANKPTESTGIHLNRTLWVLVYPWVSQLRSPVLYLLMICLHKSLTVFTGVSMTPLSVAPSRSILLVKPLLTSTTIVLFSVHLLLPILDESLRGLYKPSLFQCYQDF